MNIARIFVRNIALAVFLTLVVWFYMLAIRPPTVTFREVQLPPSHEFKYLPGDCLAEDSCP